MSKEFLSASLKFHKHSLKNLNKSSHHEKDERDKKIINKSIPYDSQSDSDSNSESNSENEGYNETNGEALTKYLPKAKISKDDSDNEIIKPVYRGAWSDDESSQDASEEEDDSDSDSKSDRKDDDSENESDDSKDSNDSDDKSDSDSENSEIQNGKWNNKDLHVSSRERADKDTFEDREQEAKEAARLQKKRAERIKKSIADKLDKEFGTDSESESEMSDEEDQTNEELEVELIKELKTKLDVVQKQLEPLITKVRESGFSTHEGLTYLETKYQLLLSYCMNIIFFLTLKSSGQSVEDHPVIEYLVEQRKLLEKVKPIDDRMKNQIDRLISLANSASSEETTDKMEEDESESEEESSKPNLADFMDDDDDLSEDSSIDESSDEEQSKSQKKEELYVAPKLMAVSTNLDQREKKLSKYEKKKEQLKQRLIDSGIIQDFAEEYGDAPILRDSNSGIKNNASKAVKFAKEVEEYEANNLKRVHLTKQQRKLLKEAERNVTKFGDELMNLEAYSDYITHEAQENDIEDEKVTVLEYLDEEEAKKFLDKQGKKSDDEHKSKKRKREVVQEPDFDESDDDSLDIKSKKKRRLEEEDKLEGDADIGRRAAGAKELQNRGIRHNKRRDLKNSRVKYKKRFDEKTSHQRNLESQIEKLRAKGNVQKINPNIIRSTKAK